MKAKSNSRDKHEHGWQSPIPFGGMVQYETEYDSRQKDVCENKKKKPQQSDFKQYMDSAERKRRSDVDFLTPNSTNQQI